jgi:SAM-dependent methyltransferase
MAQSGMFEVQAQAYDRHVGRYTPQLAAAFCDFAAVQPGVRALDVGSGPGALAAELARRLGPASVSAVEPSESFAKACRSRVPGIEVVVAPAEVMPFADATFDATLSQLVVNFLGDAEAGVREMVRVTHPGGVVAACVWDYAGEMTLLRAFWDAAREVAPREAADRDEGVVMRWCRDGELAELWTSSGLKNVRSGALRVHATYADFADLWSPFPSGLAPSGAFCAALGDVERGALRDALRRRLDAGDQPFELTARAWAVAGTVP